MQFPPHLYNIAIAITLYVYSNIIFRSKSYFVLGESKIIVKIIIKIKIKRMITTAVYRQHPIVISYISNIIYIIKCGLNPFMKSFLQCGIKNKRIK